MTKHLPYDTDLRVPLFVRGPGISKGSTSDVVIGNIDFVPTFLGLAGIEYDSDSNGYDGIDWSSHLLSDNNDDEDVEEMTRDVFLSEYISIGTKCLSACPAWYPGKDGESYPGHVKSAPCSNDQGQEWMIDVSVTGNWRALRIMNETDNMMYVEWYKLDKDNKVWNASVWDEPYWIELYDVALDPYQMHNIWNDTSNHEYYRSLLTALGDCKGSACRVF